MKKYGRKWIDWVWRQGFWSYFDEEERRLVIQSVIIGAVVWVFIYGLKTAVHAVLEANLHLLEQASTYWVVFIPLIGGAILTAGVTYYRFTTINYRDKDGHIHELVDVEGDGLERAIALYYTSEPTFEQAITGQEGVAVRWELPTFSLAMRKILATFLTLASGASGGLEGSVVLIGESLAASLFKPRHILTHNKVSRYFWQWWEINDPDYLQTAQLSGIAAAVTVLLGAPFTAAFFAIEIMYRRRPIIEKLIYSLVSALVAYTLTTIASGGHATLFEPPQRFVPPQELRYYLGVGLISMTIAVISTYFVRLRISLDRWFHQRFQNYWVRHIMGATITAVIAVAVAYSLQHANLPGSPFELILGPSETAINLALTGQITLAVAVGLLIAKIFATLSTVTSGGSTGFLVPTLYFGCMVATAYAKALGYEPMVFIVPGMVASLVSIVNVPLAAIAFSIEIFGGYYMIPSILALLVASLLAHNNAIYRTQRTDSSKSQILPGASVRRLPIPPVWVNHTLIDLDLRKEFDVNVIGLVEKADEYGRPRIRLGTASAIVLDDGDILVVLGRDDNLDTIEAFIRQNRREAGLPMV